ncbi:MAG: hypothetical protein JXB24_13165 [Bacteroidales bacterium]|nr:hypothetical protein [Bacteroidales bacterium]
MSFLIILILLLVVILSIITIIIVNKKPGSKKLFQFIYAILIVVLGLFLVKNILDPIFFKQERMKRENATIERLKDIRTAQVAYKDKYGKYTGSFDTLIHFIKTDSFELENIIQVRPWNQDSITKRDALRVGILKKSTIYKPVLDSLFSKDYNVDELRIIPYTGGAEFVMAAGEVETGSQVKVKVFEAYALYDTLFKGMDRQEVINYKDERYTLTEFNGVKVGSLTEATNNAGNWEK